MLLGREAELERCSGLLERVRGGVSAALVILGDPGAGKTALLEHLITAASAPGAFTVLQARCLEAESEIPYSGLADVTRPLGGLIDALPHAQARALQAALALGPSTTPGPRPAGGDRFAVAIATLTLLAAAAETGPVVVTVDDAHWLDSASAEALVFTARRLGTEGVGMVFTLRHTEPWPAHFEALPAMDLEGLDAGAAAALVTQVRARPVPAEVTMRLWAATGGNPLALTSLAATLDEAQLLGKAQIPDPLPVGATIRRGFIRRMTGLPQACHDALLVAAAADVPQLNAVAAALGESNLSVADLEAAESRGLISIRPGEGDLTFDHPLLRSAVYHDASPSSRRAAHAALARALAGAPERRAWHLALAASGPDEPVAADLADAARQAQRRGGHGGAARALELAAQLSPSADRRAIRLFEAAQAAALAGQAIRVNDLLDAGIAAGPDPVLRARMQNLRGRVAMFSASPLRAGHLLLAEADRIEGVDAALAAQMRVEAVPAIGLAGRVHEELKVAIDAHRTAAGLGDDDLAARAGLLLGMARILAGDPQSDRMLFEASLARLAGRPLSADSALDLLLYLSAAAQALSWVGELDRAANLIAELRERTRDALLPGLLSYVLGMSSEIELRRGRLAAAHAVAAESVQLAADTVAGTQHAFALARLGAAAAAMGLAEECRTSVAHALAVSEEADIWSVPIHGHAALGLLALGAGDPGEAAHALDRAECAAERAGLGHPGVVAYAGDHAEALVRAGRRPEAEQALGRLQAQARISQGTWELGVTARCHGLLAPAVAADSHFTRAQALLEPVSAFEAARTRLCWGESLRRRRQRGQARRLLDQALETFTKLGAVTWARQTEMELEASGAAVHRTIPTPASQLTPREFQICVLVAQGATNPEIAAKLFLSRKTIEAHLGHIFAKLGVRSRTELTRLIVQNGLGEGAA